MKGIFDRFILEPRSTPVFRRAVCLGYYDGPTSGVGIVNGLPATLYFEMLCSIEIDSLRVFGIWPSISAEFDEFVELLSRFQKPQWPVWVPRWEFDSQAIRDELDNAVDHLVRYRRLGPPACVVAAEDPTRVIRAAIAAPSELDPSFYAPRENDPRRRWRFWTSMLDIHS